MPNVKPGDLCIVLGATSTKELNGRVVTVLATYNGEEIVNDNGNLVSQTQIQPGKSWVCSSNSNLPVTTYSGRTFYTPVRAITDSILYKINDQDLDEEIETEDNPEIEIEKEKV